MRNYPTSPEETIRPGTPGYSEVVITAGGTREPIDDVRYIGNFSAGSLGIMLANEYAGRGHEVTLLAPKETAARFVLNKRVSHRPYTTGESLTKQLRSINLADLVLHAAAVADYAPVKTAGKIPSDQDRLTIEMVRTPKILRSLRSHFGPATTIVGFKLLSGVSTEHLIDIAEQQIASNGTDYSVANRLDDLSPGERIVHLVAPDGQVQSITGTTSDVARGLRQAISWSSRNAALRG